MAFSSTAGPILVLQTGGTIDKDYPKSIGGYAFEIGESAGKRVLQRISPTLTLKYHTACQKDSQEITDDDRETICKACEDSGCSRILITHGTDTMILTAAYLSRHLVDKIVIITGAFKPETFKNSDADFNVGVALGALQFIDKPYIFMAMNGRVYEWDRVERDPNSGQFIPK